MSRATVFRWWKHFKDGNKRVVEDARSGRPSTAVTDVNIDEAEQLLKDKRLSLRELSGSLNVSLEKGSPYLYTGIRHESSVRKVDSS
jgi:hypothetical protein